MASRFTAGSGQLRREIGASLPEDQTSFVGRRREVKQIVGLLEASRLVTLTGPGGIGKTRLAIESARRFARHFARRVVLVELAALREPELVLPAIAAAAGIRDSGGRSSVDALADRLGQSPTLLALDNFEHLADAAPLVSMLLLRAGRGLQVLVTSRTPLRLAAEQEYPVEPLELPDPTGRVPLETLARIESVALFVERARAVSPMFVLTEADAAATARICRRLDGLPLAIELAARRTKLLSPQALLARLERDLSVLPAGPTDASARHRTLRDTIAWSYDLLTPGTRRMLAELGVFVGGFTIAAARAVVSEPEERRGADVLDLLGDLVDQSLLRVDRSAQEPRFAMLETIREFALEQLSEAEAAPLRDRHLAYFVAFADTADSHSRGVDDVVWARRVSEDRDNIRAALGWSEARGDAERLIRLVGALDKWFWYAGDGLGEGRRWFDSALAMGSDTAPGLRGKVLQRAGWIAFELGDQERGRSLFEASRTAYEAADDEAGVAEATMGLGCVAARALQIESAEELFEEGERIARRIGHTGLLSELSALLGIEALSRGDRSTARRRYETALSVARDGSDTWGTAWSLLHVGHLALVEGAFDQAEKALAESVELSRRIGEQQNLMYATSQLGHALTLRGRLDAARPMILESARTMGDLGAPGVPLDLVYAVADWLAGADVWPAATTCWTAAELARPRALPLLPDLAAGIRSRLDGPPRKAMSQSAFDAARTAGERLTLEESLELGLRAMEAVDLVAGRQNASAPAARTPLSARELEVLTLVAAGRSDAEIAEVLFISKKTASVHIAHIKDKLGAETRIEVAMMAQRLGVVATGS